MFYNKKKTPFLFRFFDRQPYENVFALFFYLSFRTSQVQTFDKGFVSWNPGLSEIKYHFIGKNKINFFRA